MCTMVFVGRPCLARHANAYVGDPQSLNAYAATSVHVHVCLGYYHAFHHAWS